MVTLLIQGWLAKAVNQACSFTGDPKPEEVQGGERGEVYSSDEEDEISNNAPFVSAADDFLAAVAAVRVGY